MFNKSIRNNIENIYAAKQEILKFDANLGGTEIYAPLQYALSTEKLSSYPKNIFLLTDGQV